MAFPTKKESKTLKKTGKSTNTEKSKNKTKSKNPNKAKEKSESKKNSSTAKEQPESKKNPGKAKEQSESKKNPSKAKEQSEKNKKGKGVKRVFPGKIFFSARALDGEPSLESLDIDADKKKDTYLKQLLNKNCVLIENALPPTVVSGEDAKRFELYTIDDNMIAETGYTKKYYAKHYDYPDMVLLAKVIKSADSIPNKNFFKIVSYLGRKHTSIIGTWDIFIKPQSMEIIMIQELASNRDMELFVTKAKANTEEWMAAYWLRQIFRAMNFISDLGICHRNIQPKYILLQGKTLEVKLSHFYDAIQYWDDKKQAVNKVSAGKGKKEENDCQAPEVHGGGQFDPISADIWSMGATMYFALTKEYFAAGTDVNSLSISVQGRELLSAILVNDPGSRISFESISTYSWYNYERSTAVGYGFNY